MVDSNTGPIATTKLADFLNRVAHVNDIDGAKIDCTWQAIIKYHEQVPTGGRRLQEKRRLHRFYAPRSSTVVHREDTSARTTTNTAGAIDHLPATASSGNPYSSDSMHASESVSGSDTNAVGSMPTALVQEHDHASAIKASSSNSPLPTSKEVESFSPESVSIDHLQVLFLSLECTESLKEI